MRCVHNATGVKARPYFLDYIQKTMIGLLPSHFGFSKTYRAVKLNRRLFV